MRVKNSERETWWLLKSTGWTGLAVAAVAVLLCASLVDDNEPVALLLDELAALPLLDEPVAAAAVLLPVTEPLVTSSTTGVNADIEATSSCQSTTVTLPFNYHNNNNHCFIAIIQDYRSTCVSRHLQLKAGGFFCQCKDLWPVCPC